MFEIVYLVHRDISLNVQAQNTHNHSTLFFNKLKYNRKINIILLYLDLFFLDNKQY